MKKEAYIALIEVREETLLSPEDRRTKIKIFGQDFFWTSEVTFWINGRQETATDHAQTRVEAMVKAGGRLKFLGLPLAQTDVVGNGIDR